MVQREVLIEAPIQNVFEIIRNFESYPEFVKATNSAKERETKKGILVDFSIEVIKPIRYTLQFEIDKPKSIRWELVKGELMKKNRGSWELREEGPEVTRALYTIDIDFGWMVPKMILDQVTKTQLPEMLDAFKKRAEAKYNS